MRNDEGSTEAMAIDTGHAQLSGKELDAIIVGTTVRGLYRGGFRYNVFVDRDGSLEGKNHVGSHNFGTWLLDMKAHTFTVTWRNGWDHTTTRAYNFGDEVRFFDADTGLWRTTFSGFELGRKPLEVFD